MARVDPSLVTDLNSFEISCVWCDAKCTIDCTDLSLTPGICPFCGYGEATRNIAGNLPPAKRGG